MLFNFRLLDYAASPSSASGGPRWFQTSQQEYESFLSLALQDYDDPVSLAGLFCDSQDMALCGYDEYCPGGRGGEPHNGGPPSLLLSSTGDSHTWSTLEETQWAPFRNGYPPDDGQDGYDGGDGGWVQVGIIPDVDGGGVDVGYGRCYTFSDWIGIEDDGIEDIVTEDHRRWILCCRDRR